MVQQKLYTEKQMREAIAIGFDWCHQKHIPSDDMVNTFIEQLTHIQLPSDEEIREKSIGHSDYHSHQASFSYGSKWIIDKILNK